MSSTARVRTLPSCVHVSPFIANLRTTMKIFESNSVDDYKALEDGSYERTLRGMHIVFGEEDNFEERYYTDVPLHMLGVSEEEAKKGIHDIELEKRLGFLEQKDLGKLKVDAGRLLFKDLFPDYDPEKFTKFDEASQTDSDHIFLKEPSLLVLDPSFLDELMLFTKRDILTELRACEILKDSPHPNIVKYLGCRVRANRVIGTYFERLDSEIYTKEKPVNVEKYIEDMRKGIEHIHSLGYCHNDVSPGNFMMREDDTAVIIDFDGCLPVGAKVGKHAVPEFGRGTEISEQENDWFGLRRTEIWMHDLNNEDSS